MTNISIYTYINTYFLIIFKIKLLASYSKWIKSLKKTRVFRIQKPQIIVKIIRDNSSILH